MDEPPLSPHSLAKQMFGESDDEDEVELLTPGQRTGAAPALPPRGSAATTTEPAPPTADTTAPTDTAASTDPINPPAPKYPKLTPEFVHARFGAYKRRAEEMKDRKGKAKNSSSNSPSPLASQGGNGTPAPNAATFPSTFTQYNHGHSSTAPQQPINTGMAPPPDPMPWGVGGPYRGTQGLPSYYPGQIQPGFNHTMPHQSAFPPWLHSQRTALPYQGLGVEPPMDRHWPYTQPQLG